MKPTTFVLALSLLLIQVVDQASAAQLAITAKARPDRVLPGLPFVVTLTVTNTGDAEDHLPMIYAIEVSRDGSESFLVRFADSVGHTLPAHYLDDLVVPSGARREFQIPIGSSVAYGTYVDDHRTWTPGTYRLRLIFDDKMGSRAVSPDTIESTYPDRVASSVMAITVEEPSGDESATWQAVLNATKGRGFGLDTRRTFRESVKLFPTMEATNRYMPYVGLMAIPAADDTRRADFLDQLVRVIPPDHPTAFQVKLTRAEDRLQEAIRKERNSPAPIGATVADAYHSVVEIAESCPVDDVRYQAKEALKRVEHDPSIERLSERQSSDY